MVALQASSIIGLRIMVELATIGTLTDVCAYGQAVTAEALHANLHQQVLP
jgi:uncharacterized protein YbjQ (UPF0145 family)